MMMENLIGFSLITMILIVIAILIYREVIKNADDEFQASFSYALGMVMGGLLSVTIYKLIIVLLEIGEKFGI